MARYIQRISLLGKERWIGWEVDGVGTEIPGLILADDLPDEELRKRGIKEFRPMPFESFLNMGSILRDPAPAVLEEDIEFRLDALQVGFERIRARGITDVPRALLAEVFGESAVDHPRVQARLQDWARAGAVELVGSKECYLRLLGRLS